MDEPIKKEKALTSFERAKVFIYELISINLNELPPKLKPLPRGPMPVN